MKEQIFKKSKTDFTNLQEFEIKQEAQLKIKGGFGGELNAPMQ